MTCDYPGCDKSYTVSRPRPASVVFDHWCLDHVPPFLGKPTYKDRKKVWSNQDAFDHWLDGFHRAEEAAT